MPTYISHLWHQPQFSLAEIESVFHPDTLEIIAQDFVLFTTESSEEEVRSRFPHLGGSRSLHRVIRAEVPKTQVRQELETLIESYLSDTKYIFALSAYGDTSLLVWDLGLSIKKHFQKQGYSLRCLNNGNKNIPAAIAQKEKVGSKSHEWNILSIDRERVMITYTLSHQDIDGYSDRDMKKSRDMQVGMLPPKLCQMMLNMVECQSDDVVYDPFCGLGTMLIEAHTRGVRAIMASDISEQEVQKTKQNLMDQYIDAVVFVRDATQMSTEVSTFRKKHPGKRLCIATEGYLGPIIERYSSTAKIHEARKITTETMLPAIQTLSRELKTGDRMVLCLACWKDREGMVMMDRVLSTFSQSGLSIERSESPALQKSYTARWSLIYRRSNQQVGREIFVLEKK